MCREASASLRTGSGVQVSQSGVWRHVEEMLGASGSTSRSLSYHALYEQSQGRIAEYEESLKSSAGASGAAFLIDGQIACLELFDRPATLERLWPRLVRSAAVEALFGGGGWGDERTVEGFVSSAVASESESYSAVGIGTHVRLTGANVVGAALVEDGTVLHASLYSAGGVGDLDVGV
jgi:hypothetical protein